MITLSYKKNRFQRRKLTIKNSFNDFKWRDVELMKQDRIREVFSNVPENMLDEIMPFLRLSETDFKDFKESLTEQPFLKIDNQTLIFDDVFNLSYLGYVKAIDFINEENELSVVMSVIVSMLYPGEIDIESYFPEYTRKIYDLNFSDVRGFFMQIVKLINKQIEFEAKHINYPYDEVLDVVKPSKYFAKYNEWYGVKSYCKDSGKTEEQALGTKYSLVFLNKIMKADEANFQHEYSEVKKKLDEHKSKSGHR